MKVKEKNKKDEINKLLMNDNFKNNQNYITEWKSFKLLNYYAFNHQGKKILYASYLDMENYLNKKLKEFLIISFIFWILYLIFPSFIFNFLILIYIWILYSFVFFLFKNKRYNYKNYLDKDIYIIIKKSAGYNFDYLNWFIKVSYDKNEK